ncbi:hypothetical protein AK830_g4772 [Neonectria ditissima]|uniref:Uncharacterized protein n=1 Tax=Neonectria ditissima TaxID=78410 RepID=A0A0P7BFG8_9HYPO|nr:hypothetical protein AK830_g4772 [Neonectria ditissima]
MMRSYAHSLDGMEVSFPPENESAYHIKPLPAPPARSRSSTRPAQRLSVFPSTSAPGNSVEDLPPMIHPASFPRRLATSLPASPRIDRRSFMKVEQLTGQNIGLCFNWSPTQGFSPVASPILIRDDSSSNYSQSLSELVLEEDLIEPPKCPESECYMPPLLEDDFDETNSTHSSMGPRSPLPPMRKSTSRMRASGLHSNCPSILEPVADLDDDQFDMDDDSWQMSQSYNHFSDTETADEYHRITSNLAMLDKQQRGRNLSPSLARSRSLTSRLSGTAKSLFSRRREPPRSVSSAHGSFAGGERPDRQTLSPPSSVLPPDSAVASPPRSVFETSEGEDSELEDGPMREVIRDFFHRRADERSTGEAAIPRSVPHQQAKDLATNAKDGAKMLHMPKTDRRRHQLRTRIKIIPE